MSTSVFTLASDVFNDGGTIPTEYTCDGEGIHPPLSISGVPTGTKSMVLLVDDPDIPKDLKKKRGIECFDHWVVYNIPKDTTEIEEGESVGKEGLNSGGTRGYVGPCPPPEYEPTAHRYFFRLYALSKQMRFAKPPTRTEVLTALESCVLAETQLMGIYDRSGHR